MLSILRQLGAAARLLLVMTLLCGVAYPLAVLAVGQGLMPGRANGSAIEQGGREVGSSLVAQPAGGPEWFQPRPSAAGDDGWDAMASGGSNLGPNAPELVEAVRERRAAATAPGGPTSMTGTPPADALTASASGLDPHVSPENARAQAPRVARVRGLDPRRVRALVEEHVEGRSLGFAGEPRVNVLELNVALADGLR